MSFPIGGPLYFPVKFRAGRGGRSRVDRWPAQPAEGETEAGAVCRSLTVDPLTHLARGVGQSNEVPLG